jgi:hypothetical protein
LREGRLRNFRDGDAWDDRAALLDGAVEVANGGARGMVLALCAG